ncbi:MAG: M56 family metallopeptidase, partial [Bacteroidales bacterium]
MGAFLVYMLEVSVCLLLFFLFNKLVLSKETFHSFNRWAWLSIIVFSFILPLFFSTLWVLLNNNPKNSVGFAIEGIAINEIVAQNKDNGAILLVKGVSIIYFLGLSLFIIRLAVSYFKMFSLLKNKDRISLSESEVDLFENCKKVLKVKRNVSLIIHKKDISPFSWMNYIVISQKDFKEDGREILIHELSHIKSHHSLDLLFVDVMILFQWFNPASWLLKQSLQQTHEYQADESVIEAGVNAKQYQLLLIKKAVGQRLYSMANSFNHSKLKNRITMMLKEKSSKWAYAKCLYALPLAFVAVTAFATPNVSNKLEEISAVNVSNKLEEISAVNVSNKLEEISTNKVTNN